MRTTLRLSILCTFFGAVSVPTSAHAQEVTRMPDTARQSVGLDTGVENAFIMRATYARRVDLGVLQDTRLFARLNLPFVTPDLSDWAIDGGLRATIVEWRDLRVALLAGPVLKSTSNEMFSAVGVGAGATMLIGYEGPRWGLSAEAGYEQLFGTHVRHSDTYREIGYSGAKDGWYALSGSTARAGLRGGVRFGAVEIVAKAGLDATGQLHSSIPPYYATLGSTYSF